jgi:hypothetical protein
VIEYTFHPLTLVCVSEFKCRATANHPSTSSPIQRQSWASYNNIDIGSRYSVNCMPRIFITILLTMYPFFEPDSVFVSGGGCLEWAYL